jgi:hypothetical protein
MALFISGLIAILALCNLICATNLGTLGFNCVSAFLFFDSLCSCSFNTNFWKVCVRSDGSSLNPLKPSGYYMYHPL